MNLMDMANAALSAIKVQVIFALILFIVMFVLTAVVFDRKGYCRFPDLPQSKIGQWLFKEESVVAARIQAKKAANAPAEVTYEMQGQQVITADDPPQNCVMIDLTRPEYGTMPSMPCGTRSSSASLSWK